MSRAPRQPRALSAAAQAAAGAGLGLAVVLLWPALGSSPREMPLGAPAASVLAVPRPERLGRERHLSVWSTVRRAVRARSAPERAAPVVAWVGTRTPEGTDNTLLILDRAADRHGRVWGLGARLPVLPVGTTGSLPREAIGGYRAGRTQLVVDLRRLRATLLRNGQRILQAPVAVGQPRWPTPRGRLDIRNKLRGDEAASTGDLPFGHERPLQRADRLAGWWLRRDPRDRPSRADSRTDLGPVSCIRMRNPDIVRLGRLMPVGTPLTIR